LNVVAGDVMSLTKTSRCQVADPGSQSAPRRFKAAWALLSIGCGALSTAAPALAEDNAPAAPDAATDAGPRAALEEVTVTATRRTQTVQDVPYNVSSIGSGMLQQSGTTSINTLQQLVPGLDNTNTGPNTRGGNNQFSMRGLRTDAPGGEQDSARAGTVAPVSTYLGETPIFYPLALKDLERVEVLKGPQGTLYGSGALAGTIRFIPNRPQFDRFSGSVDVQGGISQYSGKGNGSFDAVMNAPLNDTLAFRVSGGFERLGGFIDDVNLVARTVPGNVLSPPVAAVPSDTQSGYVLAPIRRDTNSSESWYLRPVLRWKPVDAIDAELSYLHQRVAVDDVQAANVRYPGGTFAFDDISGDPNAVINFRPGGAYKNTAGILQPSQNQLDLGALVVTADLGSASLTSATSAYRMRSRDLSEYTAVSEIYNPDGTINTNYYDYFYNYPRGNSLNLTNQRDQSVVQEVRLVSTWKKPIDYIIGAYYQAQHFNFEYRAFEPGYTQYLTDIGAAGLPRPNGDLQYYYPNTSGFKFRDRAVFGELTWHVTPQWQATGGVRFFKQDFENRATAFNYYFDGAGSIDLDVDNRSKVSDHILKFNTSYDFTPDVKLYATYSEGFRRGGANAIPLAGPYASVPDLQAYSPDKSKNHEIGLKGRLFDHALRYTVDLFYIKLENFQFNSFTGPAFPAVFNGTEAKSKGAELETEYQVTRQLSVGLSYAYTDAKVANGFSIYDYAGLELINNPTNPQTIPVVTIASHARLPVTPINSANAMANYTIPLGTAALQLHGDIAYRDSAPAYIDPTSARYWVIPSTLVMNTRVTYDSGQAWTADAFINNLTNETVFSGAIGTGQTQPNLFQSRYVGRPRTYGVGLHYSW
jgi:iron complex outermembrane receptor protein